jgi:hypothetical protein
MGVSVTWDAEFAGQVLLRVHLKPELRPSRAIYSGTGDPPEPLDIHTAAIVHINRDGRECFVLALHDEHGRLVEFLQFETLQIAVDQAAEILGVEPTDWIVAEGH